MRGGGAVVCGGREAEGIAWGDTGSLDQARRAAVTSDKTRGNSSFQREGYSLTILCHTFFFNDSCMFKYTVQRM